MTGAEAAVVLAKAAAYDNRTVTEEAAIAWSQALAGVRLQDAVEAVIAHYARSQDFVRPAHVRRLVTTIREARLARVAEPILPPDLPAEEYAAALGEWRRQVGDGGHPDVAAVVQAVHRPALTVAPEDR